MSSPRQPITFVLSGPGGVGKGTVVDELLAAVDGLWLSRSWTTREPRPGEAPDAYNFATRAEFERHIEADGFLEWVEFLDYLQGTPLPDPPPGHDVLLEIDVAGAAQIVQLDPEAKLIFLDAPTNAEQERRLRERGDSEDRVQQRIAHAASERARALDLDYTVVINDDLASTVEQLVVLIEERRAT